MDLFCTLLFYVVLPQNPFQFLPQNRNIVAPKALRCAHPLAAVFKFEIYRRGPIKDVVKKIFNAVHFRRLPPGNQQPQANHRFFLPGSAFGLHSRLSFRRAKAGNGTDAFRQKAGGFLLLDGDPSCDDHYIVFL